MQFAKFREQVAGLWLIFLRMTAKPSQQINRQSDQQGKDRLRVDIRAAGAAGNSARFPLARGLRPLSRYDWSDTP